MPKGVSKKREREYEGLKNKFKEEGRYEGREEEVAARIVNKQRAEYGETKEAREEDARGESPDRDLPVNDYQHLTVDEVVEELDGLDKDELEQIKAYEKGHKDRKTLSKEFDKRLEDA